MMHGYRYTYNEELMIYVGKLVEFIEAGTGQWPNP
jgi:hypothetical protein